MTAGTVILWRHGQTEYNAAGRLQGQSDIALNATGRRQATRAAEVLAKPRADPDRQLRPRPRQRHRPGPRRPSRL